MHSIIIVPNEIDIPCDVISLMEFLFSSGCTKVAKKKHTQITDEHIDRTTSVS